jgi:hypothetical protein
MRTRFPARLAMAIMLGLSVLACGAGGGGGGDDPTTPVKGVISAIGARQFDKIADYACAAKKEEVKTQFDFATQMAGSLEGIPNVKANDIVNAMSFTFENVTYKEDSRSGDTAKVSMAGTMKIAIDKAKITSILQAAGGDTAAAMVDTLTAGIDAMSGTGIPMDSTVDVVKEGGKWLICQ